MVIVIMGVSGSGKTTVGRLLAADLDWPFYEGDDFHPQSNVDKMSQGIALTDEDREPWLARLARLIAELCEDQKSAVLACSALKESYRERLRQPGENVCFVYLQGDYSLLEKRLRNREGHYMGADLLRSQLEALEEPARAVVVSAALDPPVMVKVVEKELDLPTTAGMITT